MAERTNFYQRRGDDFFAQLQKTSKRINRVSNIRLVLALVTIALIYAGFTEPYAFYVAVVTGVVFVWQVLHHAKLFAEKTHLENLVKLNAGELQALQGDYSFFDSGIEFIDPHHPYTHDLDIFGEGSLFQALNRCNTREGKKQLAERLSGHLATKEAIANHQEAAKELSVMPDFCQHVQASGMEMNEQVNDHAELLEWVKHPSFLYGKSFYRILLVVVPVLTVLSVVGSFFIPILKAVAMILVLTQWTILGLHLKRINAFHEYISRKKTVLEKYGSLLGHIQTQSFSSELMKKFAGQAQEAGEKVKALASLVSWLNARLNFMMNLLVNGLFLYDLQCVYRLEKWREEHGEKLTTWLAAIRDTEVLISLATWHANHPTFSFPVIQDEFQIHAEDIGHPLLQQEECVANSVTIGNPHRVLIITGANMAGKSTFLRTLGVNLVLALNGAPVCAKTFVCPSVDLRSGMRTADSLKDHQSYFYAELTRLKSIVDELQSGKPLLILLDEILKGTNSTDKQAGSMALLQQLLNHSCLALIATHDLALGKLEEDYPNQVINYCFEPIMEGDKLSFDYKLRMGIAQKMNATFLMKKMGIIPDA
jgi:DNA mismatch repair ATPase MutS